MLARGEWSWHMSHVVRVNTTRAFSAWLHETQPTGPRKQARIANAGNSHNTTTGYNSPSSLDILVLMETTVSAGETSSSKAVPCKVSMNTSITLLLAIAERSTCESVPPAPPLKFAPFNRTARHKIERVVAKTMHTFSKVSSTATSQRV